MSSIIRPTSAQMTRRLIVLGAAVFAVIVGQVQQFGVLGQSPAQFAADSDATLRVAGFAFAIWGVIYLGLLIHAVRQVLPQTGESEAIQRFGWPAAVALVSIGLWVVAAGFDLEIATIVLIFAGLIALLIPLLVNARLIRGLSRGDRDRWLTIWPLALLAGWLSIASPVNLLTVATGNGDLPAGVPPTALAMIALALVALLALMVTQRIRMLPFALPVAWGLLGVFVAEQEKGNSPLAYFALALGVAVLVGAIVLTLRLKPGIERAGVSRDPAPEA